MDKKTRIKGLDRLRLKAVSAEESLMSVSAKLQAWGVPDVGTQVLSLHIKDLQESGFKIPKAAGSENTLREGQPVEVKPEHKLYILEAYFGEDATGDELDNLKVVRVQRRGSQKNSPRQVVCRAEDGTTIVLSPGQLSV